MRYNDLFENRTLTQVKEKTVRNLPYFPRLAEKGSIYVAKQNLTSLEGMPPEIMGTFFAQNNLLTSLQYGPEIIHGDFQCWDNRLTTLEHGPHTVDKDYIVSTNRLVSLKGSPQIVKGKFDCSNNPNLRNMIGGPQRVFLLNAGSQHVTNMSYFEGGPQIIDDTCMLGTAPTVSLSGINKCFPSIGRILYIGARVTNALSVLQIAGLQEIVFTSDKPLTAIFNKYLDQGRKGMMLCQAELIQNGYEDAAQL
jgi:hypothetical protein